MEVVWGKASALHACAHMDRPQAVRQLWRCGEYLSQTPGLERAGRIEPWCS
jgi:hypothetical protein